MKKSRLVVLFAGLVLSFGGCFRPSIEAQADPSIGIATPVNVDVTQPQGAEEKPEWKLDGVVLFYYAVNFANPVSGPFDMNALAPLPRSSEFALEVVQIEISKAAASPREWGVFAKVNYGGRPETFVPNAPIFFASGTDAVNVQEAWLAYNVPLGSANDKGMKLLIKAGRVESMLGKERIDPEENALLNYSILRMGLPVAGTGLRAEFSALEGRLQLGLSLLNDNPAMPGWVQFGEGRLGAGDSNNAKSLELMAAYRHNFGGNLNPWIRGQLGFSMGEEAPDWLFPGGPAAPTTIMDFILEGGLTLAGNRPLTVALEYMLGRIGGFIGADWTGLSATVTLGVHPRVDLALRFEYDEDKDGALTMMLGANSPCAWSVAFNVTGKLTADGRLQGILEFRHDASNENIFPTDDDDVIGASDSQDTLTLAARLLF
jgi:hypothetical protein